MSEEGWKVSWGENGAGSGMRGGVGADLPSAAGGNGSGAISTGVLQQTVLVERLVALVAVVVMDLVVDLVLVLVVVVSVLVLEEPSIVVSIDQVDLAVAVVHGTNRSITPMVTGR